MPSLEEQLEMAHTRRRELSGTVRHWQRFAEQLATILKCPAIDDDIIAAVKKLKRKKQNASRDQLADHRITTGTVRSRNRRR